MQAERDGVAERVKFVEGDVLKADLRAATVVTMYLLPRLVVQLVPKLRAELPAGARIVSHDYALDSWRPDKTLIFDVEEKLSINGTTETKLYYYVVPAQVDGAWALELERPVSPRPIELAIEQWPDRLEGAAIVDGVSLALRDLGVRADAIKFDIFHAGRMLAFRGRVSGATMTGEMASRGGSSRWTARRLALTRERRINRRSTDARVRVTHAATAVARTVSSARSRSSTCADVNSPSGPRGVRSVNGDS